MYFEKVFRGENRRAFASSDRWWERSIAVTSSALSWSARWSIVDGKAAAESIFAAIVVREHPASSRVKRRRDGRRRRSAKGRRLLDKPYSGSDARAEGW